jgi:hypothetical protein
MAAIFVVSFDGRNTCLRYLGVRYYGLSPGQLADQLGIAQDSFTVELDPQQFEKDQKDAARLRNRRHNQTLDRPWGY